MKLPANRPSGKPHILAILLHAYFLTWGVCSIAFQILLWSYERHHKGNGDDTLAFVIYQPTIFIEWIMPLAGMLLALLGWRQRSLLVLAAICGLDLLVFLSALGGIADPGVVDFLDWVVRIACLVLPLWWFFRLRTHGRFPPVEIS